MSTETETLEAVSQLVVGSVSASWCGQQTGLGELAQQGKRLRASVAVACASLGVSIDVTTLVRGCAAIETVHLATLVHDDIIDQSPERRGLESTWHAFGTERSIVTGDALFGLAFGHAAAAGADVANLLARALEDVCAGQMMEMAQVGRADRSLGDIERVASLKTGSLFGAAAALGVLSTKSPRVTTEQAWSWGTKLGIAYQLLDDLQDIDIEAGADGGDLRAGLLTQPWILSDDLIGARQELRSNGRVNVTPEMLTKLWESDGPPRASNRLYELLSEVDADSAMLGPAGGDNSVARRFQASGESLLKRNRERPAPRATSNDDPSRSHVE